MTKEFEGMRDFLVLQLQRPLTEKETKLVAWLSQYEYATYQAVFDIFKELASVKKP